ncbi:MAG: tetratricopeptide repeat protein [Planctomycetota bacterium]
MDASRRKALEILREALDLEGEKRERLLAERCGDDAELRADVDRLIGMSDDRTGFLPDSAPAQDRNLGRTFGNYTVLSRIGAGGMGIVYEAEQASPKRRVALKLLSGLGSTDEYRVRLFRREGQSLARLEHPGIAAIYEAGTAEDGEHWLAMEYVDGEPLSAWLTVDAARNAREARDRLEERVRLLSEICHAIGYAHGRGVIHRDIKPANILVQASEETKKRKNAVRLKILDFGLARLTAEEGEEASVVTEPGQVQGTLAYMSPEQARGDPEAIDVRSDVYSLGVLLHQMLTGELPHQLTGLPIHEAVRTICEDEVRPVTQIGTALGGRPIPPDLATILATALQKDPERRYASALALAGDLDRFLADQPILARPPSTFYLVGKIVRRHRGAVAAAGIFVLLLVVFIATLLVQRSEIIMQRDLARVEAQTARRITDFLENLYTSVDPGRTRGRELTVKEVFLEAIPRVDRELKDEPEIQSRLLNSMGRLLVVLGEFNKAQELLTRSREIRITHFGEGSAEVLKTDSNLIDFETESGDYESARARVDRAIEAAGRLPDNEELLAELWNQKGVIQKTKGETKEAEESYEKSLSFHRKHAAGKLDGDGVEALANLGELHRFLNNYDDADRRFQEALKFYESQYGTNHPRTASMLSRIARLENDRRNFDVAEKLHRRVLEIRTVLFGEVHVSVASSTNELACSIDDQRRWPEAEPIHRKALAMRKKVLPATHQDIGTSLNNLAENLRRQGKFRDAIPLYKEAEALVVTSLGADHPHAAALNLNLSLAYRRLKNPEKFAEHLGRAYEISRKSENMPKVLKSAVWSYRARAFFDAKQLREAADLGVEMYQHARSYLPPNNGRVIGAACSAAGYLRSSGRAKESVDLIDELTKEVESGLDPNSREYQRLKKTQAACQAALKSSS